MRSMLHLPSSLKFGSSVTEPDRKGLGSFEHPGTNGKEKESGIFISWSFPEKALLTHAKVERQILAYPLQLRL